MGPLAVEEFSKEGEPGGPLSVEEFPTEGEFISSSVGEVPKAEGYISRANTSVRPYISVFRFHISVYRSVDSTALGNSLQL